MNKKVLVLSEAIGTGHTKAAEALIQGISYLAPSVHTQVVEVGKTLNPLKTKLLVFAYLKTIMRSPIIWKKIYHYQHNKPLSSWKKFIIYHLFHRQMEVLLAQEKPNLIICTHPFSSASVARLKKVLASPLPLCTVITDFHVHGAWVHSEVDVYLVANKHVSDQLINMGVPENRIAITGLPLRLNFWGKKNKQDVRQKLKLQDIPVVMIMGGGFGLGGIQELATALLKWKDKIQLIICTGKNEKLRSSLVKDKRFHHPHIRILGFTEHIDEWMDAADLLITKPGGLTCFEAISKGLPLYIYQPIPGHEERNCNYLVDNQLAIRIDDANSIDKWIKKHLSPKEKSLSDEQIRQDQQEIDPLASAGFIINFLIS